MASEDKDSTGQDAPGAPLESFGTAPLNPTSAEPNRTESVGSAPDPGHGEIGEAPKPSQTIGDAPAGASSSRSTPLLVGGGVALLAIIAVIVAFVSR